MKFLELNPERPEAVEQEKSMFDDYDEENGYNEIEAPTENLWKICRENVDRIVKISISLMKESYQNCMKSDIMSLLDHLKFEIQTAGENERT